MILVLVSMNNAIGLAESIRTISAGKLQRNISLSRMHHTLIDLFVDRTAIDTTLAGFVNDEDVLETLRYMNCLSLNDERTIKFHQSWKQDSYVFDEKRQIWIDGIVDAEKDDMFIPRDDVQ